MTEEPHLPNRNDLEVPLLRILLEMGGSIKFSSEGRQIEIELARVAGVSDEDRDFSAPNYKSAGNRKWRNEIQFVRDQLVKKGCIDNSQRDYWTITEYGKQLASEGVSARTLPDDAPSALATISITHGVSLEEFVPDPEGRKKIVESVQYERSLKNRQRAIDCHGNSCIVCGFSFDAVYGADLARGFIEIHHTEPVAELGGRVPDIVDGLVPICSNCHSMAHRSKGKVVSIRELKRRIEQGAAHNH